MESTTHKVITRFAPSPTGTLHIGSARTALFSYLWAKKNKGEFLLRIEDTDRERSTKTFEDDILHALEWLGLKHDGEIVRQSERGDIYEKYITALIEDGRAYESEEEKDGKQSNVIRFKNPNKEVTFSDAVRGEVTFNTEDLGDFVIARDRRSPLYHLAVVIDDHEMGVTDIIRGEDHISNTPRQILIQEAIGAKRPRYAHIPLVLGKDKSKLSKRHGAVSVSHYHDYLPLALTNYLALLGWSPEESLRQEKDDIFTMPELISNFSLNRIQKGGAVFDVKKLKWINRQHIKNMPKKEQFKGVDANLSDDIKKSPDYEVRLEGALDTIVAHIDTFSDVAKMSENGELDYLKKEVGYEVDDLFWKDEKDKDKTKERLQKVITLLEILSDGSFSNPLKIKEAIWDYATEEGRGSVLWPMRYALSGQQKSPDPFTLAQILGKEETIIRLGEAVRKLSE